VAPTPPAPPVASFTFGPPSPKAGVQNVLFDGRASTGAGLTYSWNFGDGSPFGAGSTVNHVYLVAGPYSATLTVTDGVTGLSNTSAAQVVTVVP
jgi:PKD repeat protein